MVSTSPRSPPRPIVGSGRLGCRGARLGASGGETAGERGARPRPRHALIRFTGSFWRLATPPHGVTTIDRREQASQTLDPTRTGARGRPASRRDAPLTRAPSRTTGRPLTTVWRTPTGPQRSHASIGSASAPANDGPTSGQTATSADGAHAQHAELAIPAEASRAAERGDLQRHPRRARARTVAELRQQHRRCAPRATARPHRRTRSRRHRGRPSRRPHADRRPVRSPTTGSCCSTGSARRRRPRHRAGGSRRRSASRSAPPTCGRCTNRCARGTPSAGSRTWRC